jgi:hypothetical protein
MNKRLIVVGLVVLVGSLAVAGLAFAQTATQTAPGFGRGMMGSGGPGMMGYGQGYTGTVPMGPGRMGGYGWTGGYGMMMGGAGPMHDYMLNAFAEALGLERAALDERLAAGETMFQVAEGAQGGLSWDEFYQTMLDARAQALERAVADGVLTQEQADWMKNHMGGRGGNFGNCPHLNPTDPAQTPSY